MKKFISKDDVTRCISITDIASEFGIPLEEAYSGNFNKKCTCPSKDHKGGSERTGSLYIDTMGNNFYCFGCNTGNNVIDFYMMCADLDFTDALKELKSRIDPSKATGTYRLPVQSNLGEKLQISALLRKTMRQHPEDLKWISQFMEKVDRYIFDIPQSDMEQAKKLHKTIKQQLKKRYG
jgi:hypothetical protein